MNGLGFVFTFRTFRDGIVVKFWKHVVTVLTVIDMFVWKLRESKRSFAFINRHKLLKPLNALIISIENQIAAIIFKVIRQQTKKNLRCSLFLVFVCWFFEPRPYLTMIL